VPWSVRLFGFCLSGRILTSCPGRYAEEFLPGVGRFIVTKESTRPWLMLRPHAWGRIVWDLLMAVTARARAVAAAAAAAAAAQWGRREDPTLALVPPRCCSRLSWGGGRTRR
jgi:hypothetical protein